MAMDTQAALSITEDAVELPFTGNPTAAYFAYSVTSWTSATPIQSDVIGGGVMTVAGTGFRSRGYVYEARFAAGPYRVTSTCQADCPAVACFALKCPIPGALAVLSCDIACCLLG
jgi:hypothetical protein